MSDYKNFSRAQGASAKNGKQRGVGFSPISKLAVLPFGAVGSLGAGVGLWNRLRSG